MQGNTSSPNRLSNDHLHGQITTNPPERSQKPGRNASELDKSPTIGDENGVNLPREAALVVIIGTLSPYIGFCWWLMLISFPVTYYYTKFVISSFRPPRGGFFSRELAKFATQTILYLILLAGMLYWCFSIAPFHIFWPTAIDLWTPYRVHEPLHMTELLYDPGHSASIDIFAIHGLGSMPESAWTYSLNDTKVRWLSELLPLTEGFEHARIVMVNHPTRWDSNAAFMEFNDHASGLLEHIESRHKANPDRPIIFIAHSFGGLLLKKALLLAKSHSKDVAAMTRGIIFLGVPHRGTYAAFVASCLSCMAFFRGSSSSLHEFMSVDGAAILDLENEFYDGYVLPRHPDQLPLYICDVLEMRPERIGKFVLGRIDRSKRGLLRHGRVFTLDTDHRGLNKFHSHDDPNFQIIVKILSEAKVFALKSLDRIVEPLVSDLPDLRNEAPPSPPNLRNEVPPSPPNLRKKASLDRQIEAPPSPPDLRKEAPPNPPDILEFLSSGIPWMISNRIEAFALGGFQEYLASLLAGHCNLYGRNLNGRYSTILIMAFYECFVGASIGQDLCWLLFILFQGCTSVGARIVQIVISSITIVLIQRAFSLVAMELIADRHKGSQLSRTISAGIIRTMMLSLALFPICVLVSHVFLPPDTWIFLFHFGSFFINIYIHTATKTRALLRKDSSIRVIPRDLEVEPPEELQRYPLNPPY
ncbi:hypothetical protein F4860DRAFT_470448 [Xylaria cubensis]|nr:hypothetical protein F4860DRAFT_470448 [Xylaria cubensis]